MLANRDVFVLILGEFVAVQSVGPFATAVGSGNTGTWTMAYRRENQLMRRSESGWIRSSASCSTTMRKRMPMTRFVVLHALVDPVQAVAFGGRAVVRACDHVDGGLPARLLGDGAHGGTSLG